jgi:cytochrome oxidase Cu insertion factor (SCO1/SenC/PrrC family)
MIRIPSAVLPLSAALLTAAAFAAGPAAKKKADRKADDRPQEGKLKVGDVAPDFTLKTQDGKGEVKLSAFRGKKPVVLVFGSYT